MSDSLIGHSCMAQGWSVMTRDPRFPPPLKGEGSLMLFFWFFSGTEKPLKKRSGWGARTKGERMVKREKGRDFPFGGGNQREGVV